MTCSRFNLRGGLLKALLACSLGPAALWLFPVAGRAQTQPCINTHSSLGLSCLTREELNRKIQEWATAYRAAPGFAKQWGLGAIHADRAYAHLKAIKGKHVKPGEGVTIGFVDTGIDRTHPSFKGTRIFQQLFKFPTFTTGDKGDKKSHGTSVASVAAGGRISAGPDPDQPDVDRNRAHHGVAWGADINMYAFPQVTTNSSVSSEFYKPLSLTQLNSLDGVYGILATRYIKSNNIDILNISLGSDGSIEDYSAKQLRSNYSRMIEFFAQDNSREKMIVVRSAGNDHGKKCRESEVSQCINVNQDGVGQFNASSPHFRAGLPALIPRLRSHYIAVVATKQDGSIADFSNRCGIAADWCIAAPGKNVRTAFFGPYQGINGVQGWTSENGTSLAAPMVSGSLAVMKQLFRSQLSNTELVIRLYATANKTGIYANRAIYGQGFLDLGAATNPWGVASFMGTGQSVGQQTQGDPDEPESAGSNSCGQNTINTHSSLGLGCLTREKLNEKVQEWATAYRVAPGFAKQWGLGAIHADRAYAHIKAIKGENIKPGEGVTIGFVDSGMDPTHPSFAASKVNQKLMRGASGANTSHGTAVASVAAGGRISSGPNQSKAHHGVAWGADVAMFAIPAEVYPVTRAVHSTHPTHTVEDNKERVGLAHRDDGDARFFQSVLRENIDILNLSFPSAPFPGAIDDYRRARLQKNYKKTIAALAQKGKQEKTILVWSAGDVDPSRSQTPGSSPQLMAGLPARIKELRGHSVAVVATKQDGAIADFSNRCGRAAQWCIAAPGQNVHVASSSSQGWSTLSSTSVAAPMVSGGLAVMKQLFRDQLSNTELVSRLFSTAKKDGIHADSSIYGQGLMDLGAATNPWGVAAFMGTGQAVGGQSRGDSVGGQGGGGVELSRTSLSLGSAMGDGLSEALARQEIAAFDSLGAPFWFPADSFTLPAEGPSLAARFQQFLAPAVEHATPESWQVDFQPSAPALEAGHLALTHGADRLSFHGPQGLSATLFQRPADYDQSPLAGVALSWNPQNLPALSLSAGYLHEQEELLGSQGSGAFGDLSGHTLFLSTELDTTTPQGWELSAQGELGMVNPAVARSQFINHVSTLTSSAFRLQARKPLDNGASFRLALSQPLRVESGAAALSLPTGRTKDGLVVGTDLTAPLSPSGRQLDLTAQLDLPLLGGELSLAATHSRQPQHQQGAEGQWTFFTGYRANW